ncbi:MAG: hypothetical protein ACFFDY_14550 [Candidatus Thorarchaeota archaeon]
MKYKKTSLSLLLLLMVIPINNVLAFSYIDNMNNGNYIFFLIDLDVDHNIELSLTHSESGNFTLFLFNVRPVQSYINNDNTLRSVIFNTPPTVAYSLDDNPYINYTATEEKIYYIEIILINGGPDTFFFTSTITYSNGTVINKELTRYYLPIIPSFPLEFVITSFLITASFVLIIYKKKMSNKQPF